jgi:hypothetical protein
MRMPPPPRWAVVDDPPIVPTPSPPRENPFLQGNFSVYRDALNTLDAAQAVPDEVPVATDTRMQPE